MHNQESNQEQDTPLPYNAFGDEQNPQEKNMKCGIIAGDESKYLTRVGKLR